MQIAPLNYPKTELKFKKSKDKIYVWDIFRQRQTLLTPEEWVRQHVLHFLVKHKNVPKALIAVEQSIQINNLNRRCDGVIFSREGKPIAIIECKAPEIKLTKTVLYQIAQYNFKLRVRWLIITNGLQTIIADVNQQTGDIVYLTEIPDYTIMNRQIIE